MDLALATAAEDNLTSDPAESTGLFAPPAAPSSGESERERARADNAWSLLVARLGTICLQYIGQVAVAAAGLGTGEAGGLSPNGGVSGGGSGSGSGKGDAMEGDFAGSARGAAVVRVGHSDVEGAVEAAMRGFELLSSPVAWRRRWPGSSEATAESRHRALMSSLALGVVVFGAEIGPPAVEAAPRMGMARVLPGNNSSKGVVKRVRLSVRVEKDGVSGKWTQTPRLFGVLRVIWDVASAVSAGGSGGGEGQALRLLCSSSFQALGISSGANGGDSLQTGGPNTPVVAAAAAGAGGGADNIAESALLLDRRALLEAFAAAILPAPRLLEHPFKALLMDPMLTGDAGAWWKVVAVAGEAVGVDSSGDGRSGCGGAARRRDVAWAVANILRVSFLFVSTWCVKMGIVFVADYWRRFA